MNISIDDFMKLWNRIYLKNYSSIMGNLPYEIKKLWEAEITSRFKELKAGGSYGEVSFGDIITSIQNSKIAVLPRKRYFNKEYVKTYKNTYVKEGILRDNMLYTFQYGSDDIKVEVFIPFTKDKTDGYLTLESERSFIKSSFLLVWPKIIKKIMESIK